MNKGSVDDGIRIVLWSFLIPAVFAIMPHGQTAALYFFLPLLVLLVLLVVVKLIFFRIRKLPENGQAKRLSVWWIVGLIIIFLASIFAVGWLVS